ncbi:hypothetical protein [Mycoplasmopsis cynos]|uniref:hypothetical protein n=1 Tax=Mycoplasmopsis cynos TaxID=171284 RepID=UPI0021FEEE4C|nr:hypothetical protein [Mycoplasmopsis cynos]UWV92744.1 hypothetical protein NWE57_01460 [Mycoplasmopsis cynos]
MGKKFSSFIDAHCHITKRSYNLLEMETIALRIKSDNIEFIINNGTSRRKWRSYKVS